jgi:hypothetical protein
VSVHDLQTQMDGERIVVSLSCSRGGTRVMTIDRYRPEPGERMACSCGKYGVRFDGTLLHAGPIEEGKP